MDKRVWKKLISTQPPSDARAICEGKMHERDNPTIHKDCRRCLQICEKKYNLNGVQLRRLQAAFELYFLSVYALSGMPFSAFYEGLTDVFEVLFSFGVNARVVIEDESIVCNDDDYEVPAEFGSWFICDVAGLVAGSAEFLANLYVSEGHFKNDYFERRLAALCDLIETKDARLFALFEKHPDAMAFLYGYTVSNGIHYAENEQCAQIVTNLTLSQCEARQLLFLQRLISVSARLYFTLLQSDKSSEYYKLSREFESGRTLINCGIHECTSKCVGSVLSDELCVSLVQELGKNPPLLLRRTSIIILALTLVALLAAMYLK